MVNVYKFRGFNSANLILSPSQADLEGKNCFLWCQFFLLRVDPISQRLHHPEKKKIVTKVVPPCNKIFVTAASQECFFKIEINQKS